MIIAKHREDEDILILNMNYYYQLFATDVFITQFIKFNYSFEK